MNLGSRERGKELMFIDLDSEVGILISQMEK